MPAGRDWGLTLGGSDMTCALEIVAIGRVAGRPEWCAEGCMGFGALHASVHLKVVPRPRPLDSAHMLPPMCSASFRLIARPRPLPP